ncbi:MAG: SLATT domain-containing protein [Hyphomicrobiaceae bacterium]
MADSLSIHPRSASPQRATQTHAAKPNAYVGDADQLSAIRARYLNDWTRLKRARFNAARRYEDKLHASLIAFAIAGVVGFAVPFFSLLFANELNPFTVKVFDFVSYVTGGLSLTLGFMDQMKDHGGLAKRMHTCGLGVNQALRKLRNTPVVTTERLNQLVADYEAALAICDVNHESIDEDLSDAEVRLAQARKKERSYIETGGIENIPEAVAREVAAARRDLKHTELRLTFKIYRVYGCVWLLPPLIGLISWVTLSPATSA